MTEEEYHAWLKNWKEKKFKPETDWLEHGLKYTFDREYRIDYLLWVMDQYIESDRRANVTSKTPPAVAPSTVACPDSPLPSRLPSPPDGSSPTLARPSDLPTPLQGPS